jgi:hypothetical protein
MRPKYSSQTQIFHDSQTDLSHRAKWFTVAYGALII